MRRRVLQVSLVLALLAAFPVLAQSAAPVGSANHGREVAPYAAVPLPNLWGTSSTSVLNLPGHAFQPYGTGTIESHGFATISITGGSWVVAPVHLPPGALVLGIVYHACDHSAGEDLGGSLFSQPFAGGGVYYGTYGFGTGAGTPGCTTFVDSYPLALQVSNTNQVYEMEVRLADGSNTRLIGVQIVYRLQVSEAPESAQFADVPVGHALHQYVEALAASGITAGCGGGNFCPNSPLTRGQMAVFLAKALGLHFSP